MALDSRLNTFVLSLECGKFETLGSGFLIIFITVYMGKSICKAKQVEKVLFV